MSKFTVDYFVSQSAETFLSGTLLCCASEIFRQQKSFWLRLWAECHEFSSKVFFFNVPKNFIEESSSVSII